MPALSGVLARPRLFTELDQTPQGGVAWLHAPAGAGKTSLIASYLEDRAVLWYELDAADRDVSTVFHHLSVAAGALREAPIQSPAFHPGAVDLAAFSRRFLSSLFVQLERPFWLVLDNEQEVGGADWDTILRELVGALPKHGHLLVASRRAPPVVLARYRAANRLRVLGFDALRFEREEIAELLGDARSSDASELARITRGWAMAVSMLAKIERTHEPVGVEDESLQPVFDFLAGEVFEQLTSEQQSLLLQLALFPHFTARMAAKLTGRDDVESALASLSREQRLVERSASGHYSLHDLLRTFLLTRLRLTVSPAQRRDLQARAAGLLATSGEFESAVELLADAQEWVQLIALIERAAPSYAAQGRLGAIGRAIAQVPGEQRDGRNWLTFWSAVDGIGRSPSSRVQAEAAFNAFAQSGDIFGQHMAWALVIRALTVEGEDFRALSARLEQRASLPPFPPVPQLEAQLALAELIGWATACICDREAFARVEAALSLVRSHGSADERVLAISASAVLFAFGGESQRARALITAPNELAACKDPIAQLAFRGAELMVDSLTLGVFHELAVRVEDVWAVTRAEGIAAHDVSILFVGTLSALASGNLETAQQYLSRMRESGCAESRRGRAGYAFMAAWDALERADYDACDDWLLRCERETDALGFAYARHTARCGRLLTSAMRGDADLAARVEREQATIVETAPSHRQRAAAALVLAYARIWLGTCSDSELADAMSRARRVDFTSDYFFGPKVIRVLCSEALTRGIELDYAAKLLRGYALPADERALLLPGWPWPVRLRLLGTVEINVGGQPVEFGRKLPRVPLALLKLLSATQGTVSLDKLGSQLWPNLGRTSRRAALDSAIYRLRKLLDPEALVLERSGLGLNHARCWSDVRAAERACALLERQPDARLQQALRELAPGPLASASDPKPVAQASALLSARIDRVLL